MMEAPTDQYIFHGEADGNAVVNVAGSIIEQWQQRRIRRIPSEESETERWGGDNRIFLLGLVLYVFAG